MEKRITFFIFTSLLTLIWISVLQAQVDTLWTKTFGGIEADEGNSVQQTTDGGFIICGSTTSFGAGLHDVYLIKTDDTGDTLWTKSYGGSSEDWGYKVLQTNDGGYIITGAAFSSDVLGVLLIKTDSSGDTLRMKKYNGIYGALGNSIQEKKQGGYIIAGTMTIEPNNQDVWLIDTDEKGDSLWTKNIGGNESDYGNSVQQTQNGGYIITGETYSFGAGGSDVWLIKTDASGDTIWTKTFGGIYTDAGASVQQTIDGGYIIAGSTNSYGIGDFDVWLIKTNAYGETEWKKTFGGNADDLGLSVRQTKDLGYIILGETQSFGAGNHDVWLIKTDASGDTIWTKTFGGKNFDAGNSIQETKDGGYIITGYTYSFGMGKSDVWLIKTTPDITGVESNTNEIISDFSLHQNYPNPFNPTTKIKYQLPEPGKVKLTIYDVLGKEVEILVNEDKPAGTYEATWNAANLPSGVYFYQINTGNFVQTKKMILLR